MNTSNLKDVISTICAYFIAVGTVLAGLNIAVLHLPNWVTVVGAAMVAIGSGITSVLTGKNPDGTTKPPDQVASQNAGGK